jgi:hypothetical protein
MARTRILRKKIKEILEREGPLTGGQIKEFLDNETRWGGGSINSVVMLLRRNGDVEKKSYRDEKIWQHKRYRQIVWGLKE